MLSVNDVRESAYLAFLKNIGEIPQKHTIIEKVMKICQINRKCKVLQSQRELCAEWKHA